MIAEGGRIYLAKDTFTRAEHFRAMEPRLDAWTANRRAVVVYYGRYPSVLFRLQRACARRAIPLVASVVEWRLAFDGQTLGQRR